MKASEFKTIIKESVREVIQEELREILGMYGTEKNQIKRMVK